MTELDDPDRLAAVERAGLGAARPVVALQRVARLAARALHAQVALVTLVDDRRQLLLAEAGFRAEPFRTALEVPLSHCVCRHVIERDHPLRIADIRVAPLLSGNDAILAFGWVAYLGVPLRTWDGLLIGTVAAIDERPRRWLDADEAALLDLAAIAADEERVRSERREHERIARRLREEVRRDEVTGLHNRRFWRERAAVELSRARRDERPAAAVMLDLDAFKHVNDTRGHAAGDVLLSELGRRWRPLVREPDVVVRWGGDEFAVLLLSATRDEARAVAERLCAATEDMITASYGVAEWDHQENADGLLARADRELLATKRAKRGGT